MYFEVFTGFLAIVALLLSGEYLVKHCVAVAKYFGISPSFIGLTVISIGTSIPEIATHVVASIQILRGDLDLVVGSATVLGTNIGSDIVQQNMIIGLVALIGLVSASKKFLKQDFAMMIGAAAVLLFCSYGGFISRFEGAVMVILYGMYVYYLWKQEKPSTRVRKKTNVTFNFVMIFLYLTILVVSAEHILSIIELLVRRFHIGGSLIGVIILGISTALPELITSIIAITKRNVSLSLGTLVGSNITNPLFGVGIGAVISTYVVPNPVIWFDLPIKILTALVIFYFFWQDKKGITKTHACIMIAMYILYILARSYFFALD